MTLLSEGNSCTLGGKTVSWRREEEFFVCPHTDRNSWPIPPAVDANCYGGARLLLPESSQGMYELNQVLP